MNESEYAQSGMERMHQLEVALVKAKAGCASEDDWKVIYFECGLTPSVKYKLINGVNYESNSVSRK
jgi:hypothetical protein